MELLKSLYGLKTSIPIAGFFGGVVYATLTKNLSKAQIASSVFLGIVVASYLTPLVTGYASEYTNIEFTQEMQSGVAFLLGVTALCVIPNAIRLISYFHSPSK